MKTESDSIQMLEVAASALSPLLNEVAFIGGAVASLYVASETATYV